MHKSFIKLAMQIKANFTQLGKNVGYPVGSLLGKTVGSSLGNTVDPNMGNWVGLSVGGAIEINFINQIKPISTFIFEYNIGSGDKNNFTDLEFHF